MTAREVEVWRIAAPFVCPHCGADCSAAVKYEEAAVDIVGMTPTSIPLAHIEAEPCGHRLSEVRVDARRRILEVK